MIDTLPLWFFALPLTALAALVFKLDVFWVCLAMKSESVLKFFFGLARFRSGAWIHDLTRLTYKKEE
jgi:Na+-driven multidrug efflux pump